MFALPDLAYPLQALEPVISARTLRIHHEKHHGTYVKVLNEELADADPAGRTLEEVVRMATQLGNKRLFNNAAQTRNHSFFWQSMSPKRDQPSMKLSSAIEKKFGALAQLKASFVEAGAVHFASGWVWLEVDPAGMVCAIIARC